MAALSRFLNWRAALLYTHRWLGIAGCLLFAAWFLSGIVMMYARMPELAREEQLARADALDLTPATLSPAEGADLAGARPGSVQVVMVQGRPAYRFGGGGRQAATDGATVFADTGEIFPGVDRTAAEAEARRFEPAYSGPFEYDGYLTEPDQWTLQARAQMPLHRFALHDEAGTRLYVSERSGEVILRTTSRERFWGYLGPVIHWIYFTPIRKDGAFWTQLVIWSSLAGCLMCATGLAWGLLRFSLFARYRVRRVPSRSPYIGWMKWHHWSGLLFGVVTLTWTYSGLLSMGPFDWFQPRSAVAARRAGDAGKAAPLTLDALRSAVTGISRSFAPKSLALTTVGEERYWVAERPPRLEEADSWRSPSLLPRSHRPRLERAHVSATHPEQEAFTTFSREQMSEIARALAPDVPVQDETWLEQFDGYYYDPRGARPLPVLRVRYADADATWVYMDPRTGGVVQRSEQITRRQRWLYQGLHSLDFPFLYFRRPLWDVVVVLLSVGGFVLSVTTIVPAWRRLRGHGARLAARAR